MPLSPETEKLRRILEDDDATPEIITISDSESEGNNSQNEAILLIIASEDSSPGETIDLSKEDVILQSQTISKILKPNSEVKKERKNIIKMSEVPSKRAKLNDRKRAVKNNETRKANSQTQTELVLYSYSRLVQPTKQKKKKSD